MEDIELKRVFLANFLNNSPFCYCEICGLKRSCDYHMAAEFPPDAAKRWIKKQHKLSGCNGDIKYRAGFTIGSLPTGQNKEKQS